MKPTVWEQRFERAYGVASERDPEKVVLHLFDLLDGVKAFGSERVSKSAYASMQRVILARKGGVK